MRRKVLEPLPPNLTSQHFFMMRFGLGSWFGEGPTGHSVKLLSPFRIWFFRLHLRFLREGDGGWALRTYAMMLTIASHSGVLGELKLRILYSPRKKCYNNVVEAD